LFSQLIEEVAGPVLDAVVLHRIGNCPWVGGRHDPAADGLAKSHATVEWAINDPPLPMQTRIIERKCAI